MKIAIDRMKFQGALNIVKDVAGSGQDLQILQNIKIETTGDDEITLMATNLDQTISSKVKCQISEPGVITVPSKMVVQMVGALTAPIVEFKHAGGTAKAVLSGGDVTYKIATIDAKEFPKPSAVDGSNIVFEQAELKDMLRKTSYASSPDTTRRSLMAVCLQTLDGKVLSVATDGRRLAKSEVDKEVSAGSEVIIPSQSVKFLQRLLAADGKVTVTFSKGAAMFVTDTWSVQTKLVDDKYPNWNPVVPKDSLFEIPVDRDLLISSVRQVSISTDDHIIITLSKGVMTLTANEQDMADAKVMIPVKYDGADDIKINFNPRYVLDALSSFDEDTVTLNVKNGGTPVLLTAEGSSAIAVVMPLRVN